MIIKNKNSGIYTITNSINDLIYVGSTENFQKRFSSHLRFLKRNKHPNKKLQNFVNKYGVDKISFNIVEIIEIEKLLEVEQIYLDKYFGEKCFNLCPIAGAPMRGRKASKETKNKLSEVRKGKKQSSEHAKNRAVNRIGKSLPDDVKKKISKALTGVKHSDERKKNWRGFGGLKHSDVTKAKMAARRNKAVICLNDGKIFESCKEAELFYNLRKNSVSAVCRRVLKSSKEFKFEWYKNEK